jgi:hypothetical protein
MGRKTRNKERGWGREMHLKVVVLFYFTGIESRSTAEGPP